MTRWVRWATWWHAVDRIDRHDWVETKCGDWTWTTNESTVFSDLKPVEDECHACRRLIEKVRVS